MRAELLLLSAYFKGTLCGDKILTKGSRTKFHVSTPRRSRSDPRAVLAQGSYRTERDSLAPQVGISRGCDALNS